MFITKECVYMILECTWAVRFHELYAGSIAYFSFISLQFNQRIKWKCVLKIFPVYPVWSFIQSIYAKMIYDALLCILCVKTRNSRIHEWWYLWLSLVHIHVFPLFIFVCMQKCFNALVNRHANYNKTYKQTRGYIIDRVESK